ncbi:MAG: hypothetical protein WKF87_02715 [Chryseolinea sp.]
MTANSCAVAGLKVYATMRDTQGRNAARGKEIAKNSNIKVLDLDVTDGNSVMKAIAAII